MGRKARHFQLLVVCVLGVRLDDDAELKYRFWICDKLRFSDWDLVDNFQLRQRFSYSCLLPRFGRHDSDLQWTELLD